MKVTLAFNELMSQSQICGNQKIKSQPETLTANFFKDTHRVKAP